MKVCEKIEDLKEQLEKLYDLHCDNCNEFCFWCPYDYEIYEDD